MLFSRFSDRLAEQGHTVIAVDLIEKAVLQFIAENNLEARKTEVLVEDRSLICYKVYAVVFYLKQFMMYAW